jgi:hypothetical protein
MAGTESLPSRLRREPEDAVVRPFTEEEPEAVDLPNEEEVQEGGESLKLLLERTEEALRFAESDTAEAKDLILLTASGGEESLG